MSDKPKKVVLPLPAATLPTSPTYINRGLRPVRVTRNDRVEGWYSMFPAAIPSTATQAEPVSDVRNPVAISVASV